MWTCPKCGKELTREDQHQITGWHWRGRRHGVYVQGLGFIVRSEKTQGGKTHETVYCRRIQR